MPLNELNVAVVGCGYWGPNLIRNFAHNSRTRVKYVVDLLPERMAKISRLYPTTAFITSYEIALHDPGIHAIVIATPVRTHFELASRALMAGKHVLVEKPMCMTSAECVELIRLAAEARRVLMVDHTFVYHGAVRRIKQSIERGELGKIIYFDSVRINLGLIQDDVNVISDLAPHDLSIMDYLLGVTPVSVTATGARLVASRAEEIAYITLKFNHDLIAHFHVSWLSPVKMRRILIGGTDKMVVYDDVESVDKVQIYDKAVLLSVSDKRGDEPPRQLVNYRTADMLAPAYDSTESLKVEVDHFADCVLNGTQPLTPGEAGLRLVCILEAANASLRSGRAEPVNSNPITDKFTRPMPVSPLISVEI
jgi:predicted dehydrogenase